MYCGHLFAIFDSKKMYARSKYLSINVKRLQDLVRWISYRNKFASFEIANKRNAFACIRGVWGDKMVPEQSKKPSWCICFNQIVHKFPQRPCNSLDCLKRKHNFPPSHLIKIALYLFNHHSLTRSLIHIHNKKENAIILCHHHHHHHHLLCALRFSHSVALVLYRYIPPAWISFDTLGIPLCPYP